MNRFIIALVGYGLLMISSAVRAQDLPGATAMNYVKDCALACGFETYVGNSDLVSNLAINGTANFPYADKLVSAALMTNAGIPSVQVNGSAIASNDNYTTSATAVASLEYYFKVYSASGPAIIDIDYLAKVATNGATDAGTTYYQRFLDLPYPIVDDVLAFNNSEGSYSQAREGHLEETLDNGTVSEIELTASGASYGGRTIDGQIIAAPATFSAYLDPRIYIDPAFLSTHPDAHIEISAGVGNIGPSVAAVPELSTWVLMIVGLGGTGAMIRRGRGSCEPKPI